MHYSKMIQNDKFSDIVNVNKSLQNISGINLRAGKDSIREEFKDDIFVNV